MPRERLYGLGEIAAAIGERPGTVSAWQSRGTNAMPPPDQRLSSGPVWFGATIEPWMAARAQPALPSAMEADLLLVPVLDESFLRRLLRRHLRATALLLESPPRRPALIARALRDLEDLEGECEQAASEARGPLARALRDEAELVGRLAEVRRRSEREARPTGQVQRARHVSPGLDRAYTELSGLMTGQAAPLSAAVAKWLEADGPDGA